MDTTQSSRICDTLIVMSDSSDETMTLRDELAAAALPALLARHTKNLDHVPSTIDCCRRAYAWADAMLEARKAQAPEAKAA